jgi:ABC-type amino acid transport substrate-binding protein
MNSRINHTLLTGSAAIIMLLSNGCGPNTPNPSHANEPKSEKLATDYMFEQGEWHVAYGNFPLIDEVDSTGTISGLAVDIVNEIATRCRPQLKVVWHPIDWNRMRQQLDSGEYHMAAELNMQTTWRSQQFIQSTPIDKVGICCALVSKNETRFKTFSDLNKPELKIGISGGGESELNTKLLLTLPNIIIVEETNSPFDIFENVMTGKLDVAVHDQAMISLYCKAHPDKAKMLFANTTPYFIPVGFCFSKNHPDIAQFVNENLKILNTDGTMKRIFEKWQIPFMQPYP